MLTPRDILGVSYTGRRLRGLTTEPSEGLLGQYQKSRRRTQPFGWIQVFQSSIWVPMHTTTSFLQSRWRERSDHDPSEKALIGLSWQEPIYLRRFWIWMFDSCKCWTSAGGRVRKGPIQIDRLFLWAKEADVSRLRCLSTHVPNLTLVVWYCIPCFPLSSSLMLSWFWPLTG